METSLVNPRTPSRVGPFPHAPRVLRVLAYSPLRPRCLSPSCTPHGSPYHTLSPSALEYFPNRVQPLHSKGCDTNRTPNPLRCSSAQWRARSKGALHPLPLRTLNVLIKSIGAAPLVLNKVESQRLRFGPNPVRVDSRDGGFNAHCLHSLRASPSRLLFTLVRASRFPLRQFPKSLALQTLPGHSK